jgi:hypothetical protein
LKIIKEVLHSTARAVTIIPPESEERGGTLVKIVSDFKVQVEARREICATCSHNRVNMLKAHACDLCGCIIFAKTMTPGTICPDTPPRWT